MLNFAFLLFLMFQQAVQPGDGLMHTLADKEVSDDATNISTLIGNAIITYEDSQMTGDLMTFNRSTYDVTSVDHVKFVRGPEHIEGDHMVMNAKTKDGTILHAFGYMGPGYFFTAEEAHRFEDGHYELKTATITTCSAKPTPPARRLAGQPRTPVTAGAAEIEPMKCPSWSFHLPRAVIIPGKSATAVGALFDLRGIPVFYLPYMSIPTLDRERASGFLIPSTSSSTIKGRSVSETYYWAINRSADATFTGDYFTARGPAGTVSFRAVPNKNSRLEISSFFVHDKLGQGGQSARIFDYTDLGNNYRGVLDLNLVSSLVFRQVFEDGLNLISSPIEHSEAFITRDLSDVSYSFVYKRTGVFFSDQPTVITREFPGFEASTPSQQIAKLPAYLSLDTSIAGLSRSDAVVNTPAFVGRFDFHPTVEIPTIRTAAFQWSNSVGVRETAYSYSISPTNRSPFNRFLVDYTSQLVGPTLERDYGRWRHVVEPTVDYSYVGGADRVRDTVMVDDVDLLANTRQVEYGITDQLFTTREIINWRVSQEHFFDPSFGGAVLPGVTNAFAPLMNLTGFAFADGPRRESPIVSNMRISTTPSTSTDIQADYDPETHHFDGAGINGGLSHGLTSGSIAYFFRAASDIHPPSDQFSGRLAYGSTLKPGFSAAFSVAYNIQQAIFQGSVAQLGYNWSCYGVSLEWSQFDVGVRKESRFQFAFSLKDIGAFGNIPKQARIF